MNSMTSIKLMSNRTYSRPIFENEGGGNCFL